MLVSSLLKLIAKIAAFKIKTWSSKPAQTQQKQFKYLINSAKRTSFGIDHNFQEITSYKDFVKNVPTVLADVKLSCETPKPSAPPSDL